MENAYDLLKERLGSAKTLAVLGAGSVLKADDAAGVIVVQRLAEKFAAVENLLLCEGETAPENFSGKILRFAPDHLLVIDAADMGLAPGSLQVIPPDIIGGPTYCSHMLPLRVMIDYLAGETGAGVTLLGIQYKSIEFDAPMTREMEIAIEKLCSALCRWIEECLR